MRGVAVVAALAAIPAIVGTASPAAAAADTVTLSASRTSVRFGQATTLSGTVSPAPPAGTEVRILDADSPGPPLATTTTDPTGAYGVDLVPQRNGRVKAATATGESAPLQIVVTPQLTAALGPVRLFGEARVSGRLEPAHPGGSVVVTLLRREKIVRRVHAPVDGSTYAAEIQVVRPGRYRARVTFDDADHEPASASTGARRVRAPAPLGPGSHGSWVEVLEERLRELDYHLPAANRGYDQRTGDAVLAFHKVQGMARTRNVSAATWNRLARPRIPRPRSSKPKVHIEIDQSKQVLYVVRDGAVDDIVHTSTGAGGATRDGVFHVHRKIAGFSPNRLYYPSYFDGLRAVHGWPDVPPYPASHGCSRVPYWTARFLFNVMGYGMEVRVYH